MSHIANFAEAQTALSRFYGKHSDAPYTLDRMYALLAAVGNPQDSVQMIHVAGTSGKTSTAYYAAALLQQNGAKVGLTVSPHVDQINERVQINLEPLAEPVFCKALSEFLACIDAANILPSYFECMVAFAFWEFARQRVDYAVVEVGLGGLVDGTNVISRPDKICIITDIGLDHTEILGDTVEAIAAQKAGIVHADNEVFMHQQAPSIIQVVQATCQLQSAQLHVLDSLPNLPTASLPVFQQRNFALAQAAVSFLLGRKGRSPLNEQQLSKASQVHIPARMEVVRVGSKTVIIDGAHNAQKLETLFQSISDKYPGQELGVLAGFVEGDRTRLAGALDSIASHTNQLIVTSFYSEKDYRRNSAPLTDIASYCAEHHPSMKLILEDKPALALQRLLARPETVLVVCGSFYLLNHIRPTLLEQLR